MVRWLCASTGLRVAEGNIPPATCPHPHPGHHPDTRLIPILTTNDLTSDQVETIPRFSKEDPCTRSRGRRAAGESVARTTRRYPNGPVVVIVAVSFPPLLRSFNCEPCSPSCPTSHSLAHISKTCAQIVNTCTSQAAAYVREEQDFMAKSAGQRVA